MEIKATVIIPARYASTRFPGKPLVEIAGKSMIRRVFEQVCKSEAVHRAVVATDDQRIFDHVSAFGEAVMTPEFQSGTDRVAWVAAQLADAASVVVNVQGDEPFIRPEQISRLVAEFDDEAVQIATLCKRLNSVHDVMNPNVVKVVRNSRRDAMYFSRAGIPFQRGAEPSEWIREGQFFRHLGIYAFRSATLREISALPPSALELAESLEQLRWLENGYPIRVAETDFHAPAVDHPDDLLTVDNFLNLHPEYR